MIKIHTASRSGEPVSPSNRSILARSAALGLVSLLALQAGGCSKLQNVQASLGDITGSISNAQLPQPGDEIGLQRYNSEWARRYDSHPDDKMTSLNFARGLRAAKRNEQALAVLQRAVIKHPKDLEILGDYGKALADAGRLPEAAQILERAQIPERPNWSIMSSQGSVAAQMGNQPLAQQYYQEALKLAPGEPSILSNLALSYALGRQLPQAEQLLRQAVTHPRADRRVRQNLALVLGLQGKFGEAENVLRQVLPAADASANIAAIRSMIAQSDTWRDIQRLDAPHSRKPAHGRDKPAKQG